jgi:hypothetical protein
MYYDPGVFIDLTYLNEKPKKKGSFNAQFDDEENDNLYEPGVKIMFVSL